MVAEQSKTAKEQSAFVGRMLSVPMLSLLLVAVWVVIVSVLTPLGADRAVAEQLLILRWILIGFGLLLVVAVDAIALYTLLTWDMFTVEMKVDTSDSDDVEIDATVEQS